jgi:hypothetical protein
LIVYTQNNCNKYKVRYPLYHYNITTYTVFRNKLSLHSGISGDIILIKTNILQPLLIKHKICLNHKRETQHKACIQISSLAFLVDITLNIINSVCVLWTCGTSLYKLYWTLSDRQGKLFDPGDCSYGGWESPCGWTPCHMSCTKTVESWKASAIQKSLTRGQHLFPTEELQKRKSNIKNTVMNFKREFHRISN